MWIYIVGASPTGLRYIRSHRPCRNTSRQGTGVISNPPTPPPVAGDGTNKLRIHTAIILSAGREHLAMDCFWGVAFSFTLKHIGSKNSCM